MSDSPARPGRTRRNTALQVSQQYLNVTNGIAQLKALKQAVVSIQSQVDSTILGEQVGVRNMLDVLNAQQQLLNSRTSLVQNLAQVVNASYAVAAAVGRLTARDMHLPVPLYDETAYYNAVSTRWTGLGDYATGQPGR